MLNLSNVLSSDELEQVDELIGRGKFVHGKRTAGGTAASVKNNLLLELAGDPVERLAVAALDRHGLFRSFAMPARFAPPMVCKYETGMSYGEHIDAPVMGESPPMRCDLAVTIFLSDPDGYDGGELVIRSHVAEVRVKLPAGSAIVYPAGSLHRVEPVLRGERLAIVTWVQSFIREAEIREMLFDLDRVIHSMGDSEEARRLANPLIKTHTNLYRRFAET